MRPYYVFLQFNSRKALAATFTVLIETYIKATIKETFPGTWASCALKPHPRKAVYMVPLVSTSETFCFLTSISLLENIPRWIRAFTKTMMECTVMVFSLDGSSSMYYLMQYRSSIFSNENILFYKVILKSPVFAVMLFNVGISIKWQSLCIKNPKSETTP